MRMKPTPDRVHVVRSPQDEVPANRPSVPSGQGIEIVRTLAQISDKLKRSEAERYELLNELREYRKALNTLEDKTEQTAKAYQNLEGRIDQQNKGDTELSHRQARFEKSLRDTEEKLVSAAAGQTLIDQRLKNAEEQSTALTQRMDVSITEQIRLDRALEKVSQEKARMQRKVERLEEIANETQENLRARALILLTDQSTAAQSALPHLHALARSGETNDVVDLSNDGPWWRKTMQVQSFGMASMVIAALLAGWMINQAQQPNVPQIAMLENGTLAQLDVNNKTWTPVNTDEKPVGAPDTVAVSPLEKVTLVNDVEAQKLAERLEPSAGTSVITPPDETIPAPEENTDNTAPKNLSDIDDAELLNALENNPDNLASQLNDIAPEASAAIEEKAEAVVKPAEKMAPVISPANKALEEKGLKQKSSVRELISAEKPKTSWLDTLKPDASLPANAKALEKTAFDGNAEAQHDLAAIYTAGQGGVKQNFDRAVTWFRSSADNGVSNAMYNLGVLYHQGLGVPKDMDRAIYWYREAARQSHPEAQYNLGIAYIEGIGTEYDASIAAYFFERAANNGVPEAAYNLGLIHENALLGKANPNEAVYWYKVAETSGNADAKSALNQLIKTLQIGPEDVQKMYERRQNMSASKTP